MMQRSVCLCWWLGCGYLVCPVQSSTFSDGVASLLQSRYAVDGEDGTVTNTPDQINFGTTAKNAAAGTLNWGLTLDHLKKYAEWCETNKVVLIFRQSEKDTLLRISQQTFKTKSVDIKDKSSNWGLTKGFVPLDKHLSKQAPVLQKDGGAPLPDIKTNRSADIHAAKKKDAGLNIDSKTGIQAVPLVLARNQIEYAKPETGHWDIQMEFYEDHFWRLSAVGWNGVDLGNGEFFKVQWVKKDGTEVKHVEAEDVWVWAYGTQPVTGDYDLWMAAPWITSPLLQSELKDKQEPVCASGEEHSKTQETTSKETVMKKAFALDECEVFGGWSTMPGFLQTLVKNNELNAILGHPWNTTGFKVINHGAEAQNLKFVQALDDKLTIIVPSHLALLAMEMGLIKAKRNMTEDAIKYLGSLHSNIWMAETLSPSFSNFLIFARKAGYLAPLNAEYHAANKNGEAEDRFNKFTCLMQQNRTGADFVQHSSAFYHTLESQTIPNYLKCKANGMSTKFQTGIMARLHRELNKAEDVSKDIEVLEKKMNDNSRRLGEDVNVMKYKFGQGLLNKLREQQARHTVAAEAVHKFRKHLQNVERTLRETCSEKMTASITADKDFKAEYDDLTLEYWHCETFKFRYLNHKLTKVFDNLKTNSASLLQKACQ